MPNKKTELSEALQEQAKEVAAAVRSQETLAGKYRAEEKVPVSVSPMYRPYFGNVMKVCINGVSIFMPIDNTVHKIPKTFAAEIHRRINAIDSIMKKQDRMANISRNIESSPGELPLV